MQTQQSLHRFSIEVCRDCVEMDTLEERANLFAFNEASRATFLADTSDSTITTTLQCASKKSFFKCIIVMYMTAKHQTTEHMKIR